MAFQDSTGSTIFVACRYLMGCADAVDAELAAMVEGLALALHWSPLAITLEMDCTEANAQHVAILSACSDNS